MLDVLFEFASIFIFVIGIVAGEVIAHKAFGRPKSAFVFLIDLVLIVLIIAIIYSYIGFYEAGWVYYTTNFMIGLFSIVITRAIEWMLKLTERTEMGRNQAVDVVRVLSHHGLDAGEIKAALKKMGFSGGAVERYHNLIEKTVPAYLPKMVRMEKTIGRIEERLGKIEKKLK